MVIAKGDYVSGLDGYGNGVTGEVIATGAGFIHIQPARQQGADGKWFDLAPVMVAEKSCELIEKCADRKETFALRDARTARERQRSRERER